MKKLLPFAAALVLLVLFPGLAEALARIVVVLSGQPVLVGFGLGLIAWPHIKRAKTTKH